MCVRLFRMELFIAVGYVVIYFVGYYGAHALNLMSRRVVVRNLRLVGLVAVAIAALAFAYFLGTVAPRGANNFAKGYVQGSLAIGPALLVYVVVAIRIWLERRRRAKNPVVRSEPK